MNALFAALSISIAALDSTSGPAVGKTSDAPRILIVLTSHDQKGSTGQKTGYYLSEVTHPMKVFERAGAQVEFASIKGGEPPVDGLNLDDATNAHYWNSEKFRSAVRNTIAIKLSFLPAATARCGTSQTAPQCSASRAKSTSAAA
jgi:putative intracellular protease/amidase